MYTHYRLKFQHHLVLRTKWSILAERNKKKVAPKKSHCRAYQDQHLIWDTRVLSLGDNNSTKCDRYAAYFDNIDGKNSECCMIGFGSLYEWQSTFFPCVVCSINTITVRVIVDLCWCLTFPWMSDEWLVWALAFAHKPAPVMPVRSARTIFVRSYSQ